MNDNKFVIEWKFTKDEKPKSSRHVLIANGGDISHYGYYLFSKDKWYANWHRVEEIECPIAWANMPDVPQETICGECSC